MSDVCLIEEWRIQREDVEQEVGRRLTDDEWVEFSGEMIGRSDNFLTSLFEDLIDQISKDVFKPGRHDKDKTV